MKLFRTVFSRLETAIINDLLGWLRDRALVLPSEIRDKIARELNIPRPIVDQIEAHLRVKLIEQIEARLRRK